MKKGFLLKRLPSNTMMKSSTGNFWQIGTSPVLVQDCGNENAYGDQCENCGSTLNATDLINPKSYLVRRAACEKETKNWFLPLDQYESRLRRLYRKPQRMASKCVRSMSKLAECRFTAACNDQRLWTGGSRFRLRMRKARFYTCGLMLLLAISRQPKSFLITPAGCLES
jgi:hypothetical protein